MYESRPPHKVWHCGRRFLGALGHRGEDATLRLVSPTPAATDQQVGTIERESASTRMAKELIEMWLQIDLRDVLPSVAVPTLVLHHTDEISPIEAARYVVARIPRSRSPVRPATSGSSSTRAS
jgi:pimeloyl-ACP methyl ester carboxylesterase